MKIQPISKNSSYNYNKILKLFYLLLFIPLSLIGCRCESGENSPTSSQLPGGAPNSPGSGDSNLLNGMPSSPDSGGSADSNPSSGTPNQPPIFFLAHGLMDTSKCFTSLQEALLKNFPSGSVILSKSITSDETRTISIEEQVKRCHKELSEEISKIHNAHNAQTRPIILGGHSQGGLRMARLALKLKEEGYNVKIVAINAPFEGAPVLKSENLALCSPLKETLGNLLPIQDGNVLNPLAQVLSSLLSRWFGDNLTMPGVQDLVPDSPFLSKLQSELCKANIPILAIAGTVPKEADLCEIWAKIFGINLPQLNTSGLKPLLNNLFTENVVGKDNKHDGILPVYTQLGSNTIAKSQSYSYAIIQNTTHVHSSDLTIAGTAIPGTLNSPQTVTEIEKFVKH